MRLGVVPRDDLLLHLENSFLRWPLIAFSHLGGVATRYAPKASRHTDKHQHSAKTTTYPKTKVDIIVKFLAIRLLYIAVLAAWFTAFNTAAAEPKHPDDGFSSHPDSLQVYLDYLNSLEMIKIEAGDELREAVEDISVEPSIPITPQQKAGLRGWLYDFLVAFSVSGSDSLAAEFYLREGVEDSEAIQRMKKDLESGPSFSEKALLKVMGISIPKPVPDAGDTPLAILKTQHRQILAMKGRDYFFGNISFFGSAFKVLEMQGEYASYVDYAQTHGLLPRGPMGWPPKLKKEIKKKLEAGEQRVFAQFMFIVEEPEEVASFEGAIRHPFFIRLVWSPKKNMWRLVEIFASNDAPVLFVFKAL